MEPFSKDILDWLGKGTGGSALETSKLLEQRGDIRKAVARWTGCGFSVCETPARHLRHRLLLSRGPDKARIRVQASGSHSREDLEFAAEMFAQHLRSDDVLDPLTNLRASPVARLVSRVPHAPQ